VGKDLINGIGSSEGLKVSTRGHRSLELNIDMIKPIEKGKIKDNLLGAKLGTTEEI